MVLKTPKQEDDQCSLIMESKNELMLPNSGNGVPTLKNAHFLGPRINPTNQALPKLPSLSFPSNPNIFGLTSRAHFKGRPRPLKTWKTWVENLQKTHQDLWVKVRVFDAVRASTYQIKRHNELIIGLAEKWCPETNTFIFPWAETTVTLEDVMVLGGFPVLGVSVISPFQGSSEFGEIETKLADACRELRKVSHNASHYGWMSLFRGKGGELEHVAFLVLWFSRYVFSTGSYNLINPNVFGIAISLTKGNKVALAAAVLASIYRDLSLLKAKIVSFISEANEHDLDLVLWAPFQIVQLWFWERFPMLSPKPTSLMLGEPRLARWHHVNKLQTGFLMEDVESAGDSFMWRPYGLPLRNWKFPKFYSNNGRWVCINSEVEDEILSFAMCLRACELVGMDCVEQYLPHRVGMQFGMDQDIPTSLPKSDGNLSRAWTSYNTPLHGWKLYLPPRAVNGEVTVQYLNWWKAAIFACHDNPMTSEKLSHVVDGNMGVGGKKAPHSAPPTSMSHKVSKLQILESTSRAKGLSLMGEKGDIGKDKHIAVEEDHQELQERNHNTFRSSGEYHSQRRSLMAVTEATEPPPDDNDDDNHQNNDRISQFLAFISGIEVRISSLEGDVKMLKCRQLWLHNRT